MNELTVVDKTNEWRRMKSLVLDSVSSPITKRVYNMALDEFFGWYAQEPRPGFTKATVSAWRVTLEERGLGSSSIIVRMSAIRKLAVEAMDNGLLAPELAAGIQRVKSAKSIGVRAGNWLSLKQAQALLNAPDITTLKGLVLDSVRSPITKRFYNMALDEFFDWYRLEPRPGFAKATVNAWRVSLDERGLGSSSIIVRMSAIRKLAVEATDNGLLAPELPPASPA